MVLPLSVGAEADEEAAMVSRSRSNERMRHFARDARTDTTHHARACASKQTAHTDSYRQNRSNGGAGACSLVPTHFIQCKRWWRLVLLGAALDG